MARRSKYLPTPTSVAGVLVIATMAAPDPYPVTTRTRQRDACEPERMIGGVVSSGSLDAEQGRSDAVGRIFVSYSRSDLDVASEIARTAVETGHDVFFDVDPRSGIPAGTRWTEVIYREIVAADLVLAVCSAGSSRSRWCLVEWAIAQTSGVPIIPIRIDDGPLDSVLATTQAVDCRDGVVDTRVREALESVPVLLGGGVVTPRGRRPFPGLLPLQFDDSSLYFGRERETDQLLRELRQPEFRRRKQIVVVHGGSGTGKSSFVRAGVLANLARDRQQWRIARPLEKYAMPIRELVSALIAIDLVAPADRAEVERALGEREDGPATLAATLRDDLEVRGGAGCRMALVIDQAELLTDGRPESARFLRLVDEVCRLLDGALVTFFVVRSDSFPTLAERIDLDLDRTYTLALTPLNHAALVRVIEGPAKVARIRIDGGLAATMASDASGASLPLLAYTLEAMHGSDDGALTHDSYHRAGGISGAITRQLASLQREMSDEELVGMRLAFGLLVRPNGDSGFLRSTAQWSALTVHAQGAFARLIEGRIIHRDDVDGVDCIELAHESLMEHWQALREWLEENSDFLRWRRSLSEAVVAWERHDRTDDDLLRGRHLTDALGWLESHRDDLVPVEIEMIESSHARRSADEAARERLLLRSEALRLAAVSDGFVKERFGGDPAVALRLAAESMSKLPTLEGDQALRAAMRLAPPVEWERSDDLSRVTTIAVSAKDDLCATGHADGSCRLFDLATGNRLARLQHGSRSDEPSGSEIYREPTTVTAVCFGPADNRVFSAGLDGLVQALDLERGEVTKLDCGAPVEAMDVAPHGRCLAVAAGRSAFLIDLDDYNVLCRVDHDDDVTAVTTSPDGTTLFSAGKDATVRIAPLTGERTILRVSETVNRLACSPSGRRIAAAGDDCMVADVTTGEVVARFDKHYLGVAAVIFCGDDDRVATVDRRRTSRVFDVRSDRPHTVMRCHFWFVQGAALDFSAGSLIAVGFNHGGVYVYDRDSGDELARCYMPNEITSVRFSPNGEYLLIADADGHVRVVRMGSTADLWSFDLGSPVRCVAVATGSDDPAELILVAGATNGQLVLVTPTELRHDPDMKGIRALALDDAGRLLAVGGDEGLCLIFDTQDGELLCVSDHRPHDRTFPEFLVEGNAVRFGSTGATIVFPGMSEQDVRSMVELQVRRARIDGQFVSSISITDRGHRVVSSGRTGQCRIMAPERRREVGELTVGTGKFSECRSAVSPSGRYFATVANSRLRLHVLDRISGSEAPWEVTTQHLSEPMLRFSAYDRFVVLTDIFSTIVHEVSTSRKVFDSRDREMRLVSCAALSRDEGMMAIGDTGGTVTVLDTATWTVQLTLSHDSAVWCVEFSQDGHYIATGTDLRTAHVWSARSGDELSRMWHPNAVVSLALDPWARTLVTGCQDGLVRHWAVESAALRDLALDRATRPLRDDERQRHLLADADSD